MEGGKRKDEKVKKRIKDIFSDTTERMYKAEWQLPVQQTGFSENEEKLEEKMTRYGDSQVEERRKR